MNLQDKILGGLLGAAVGDSMGAVTEHHTIEINKVRFGGNVTSFIDPPSYLKSKGHIPGLVTDDFSVGYYSLLKIIEHQVKMSREVAIEGLLYWNSIPIYAQCAGPTTKVAIERFKLGIMEPVEEEKKGLLCDNSKVTNGGGMKSGITGLLNPCDVDSAIDDAITMCEITHGNTIALASACAISAATAKAFCPNVSWVEVVEAGIYGAEQGLLKTIGKVKHVAGNNIAKKIALATSIGMRYQDDTERAMIEIADIIGCGLYANESIPAVFGFIAAAKGDPLKSIHLAVNAGDDTDTVACMVGYIVGALHSYKAYPQSYLDLINEANKFDLKKLAADIELLIEKEKK